MLVVGRKSLFSRRFSFAYGHLDAYLSPLLAWCNEPERQLALAYGATAFSIAVLNNLWVTYNYPFFARGQLSKGPWFTRVQLLYLVWNAVNDGLFGYLSDSFPLFNVEGRKTLPIAGKIQHRLSHIRLGGWLLSVSFCFAWYSWTSDSVNSDDDFMAALHFFLSLCLYDGALSYLEVNFSSLLSDLTSSVEVRATCNAMASLCSAVGALPLLVAHMFWEDNGYHSTTATRSSTFAAETRVGGGSKSEHETPQSESMLEFRYFCVIVACISVVGYEYTVHYLIPSLENASAAILAEPDSNEVRGASLSHYEASIDGSSSFSSAPSLTPSSPSASSSVLAVFPSWTALFRQMMEQTNFVWFSILKLFQSFTCTFEKNHLPIFLTVFLPNRLTTHQIGLCIALCFVLPHFLVFFLTFHFDKYESAKAPCLHSSNSHTEDIANTPGDFQATSPAIMTAGTLSEGPLPVTVGGKTLALSISSSFFSSSCLSSSSNTSEYAQVRGSRRCCYKGGCSIFCAFVSSRAFRYVLVLAGTLMIICVLTILQPSPVLGGLVAWAGTLIIVQELVLAAGAGGAGVARSYSLYSIINVLYYAKLSLAILLVLVVVLSMGTTASISAYIVLPESDDHFPAFACWLTSSVLVVYLCIGRILTECVCRLFPLVASQVVDEDCVKNNRHVSVAASIVGTSALIAKPGESFAPILGWHLLFYLDQITLVRAGSSTDDTTWLLEYFGTVKVNGNDILILLIALMSFAVTVVQLNIWGRFTIRGKSHKGDATN